MKYYVYTVLILFISCSGSYNKEEAREAENLAVLLDMSISDNFAAINKALEVWKTMPDEVRKTKNPVRNPYDFNIEAGNCKKYLEKFNKEVEKVTSLSIPPDLDDVIVKLRDLYSETCSIISDSAATFAIVSDFMQKSEPEYKKLRDKLTEIQADINRK